MQTKEDIIRDSVKSSLAGKANLDKIGTAEVDAAIESLAKIWENSEAGMYKEQELVEALAPHMSVLQNKLVPFQNR